MAIDKALSKKLWELLTRVDCVLNRTCVKFAFPL